MVNGKNTDHEKQDSLLSLIMFRFIPYWPLFALLFIISLGGAFIYLKFATPLYEASAALIIKDAQKGVTDVKFIEFSDVFSTKKIVENETEVLRSKALMHQVVNKLKLYAPIYQKGRFRTTSCYLTSPVSIEVKEPDSITESKEYSFSFDAKSNTILMDNKKFYPDQWISTSNGTFRFVVNGKSEPSSGNNYFFTLINPKDVAISLVDNLNVESTSKLSTVIYLYYTDEIPRRAEDILNELMKSYNEASLMNKNTLAANTLAFVEDRLKFLEKDLSSIEAKIQNLKSKKGIINLSEQGSLFLKNVADNDQKIASINMQLAALDQVEKYVISKNAKEGIVPSTLGVNDPALSNVLQKLYDSEIQLEKLRNNTGENNPMYISLNDQIEKMRPSVLENINNQRSSLMSSKDNLSSTNLSYSSILQGIPRKEQELLEITRQEAVKSNVYNFFLQKREETALSNASVDSDSRVIDQASSAEVPVKPKRSIIFVVAIAIAGLAGILYVFMKEVFNKKILFRSEIEDFSDVKIAGEITYVRQKKAIAVKNPKTFFIAEQFRQIRAALGMYGNKAVKKKILVTSSITGEGKSFVSVNLATSLAMAGKKVVLLDLDLRNPKTTTLFGLENKLGITDYLKGELDNWEIISNTHYNNLYVVPTGQIDNPAELLLTANLDPLFEYLQGSFDYIIIDTSPIDTVTDAYVLAEYCDTTLFVIRHGYTPKTFVQLLDHNNKVQALKNLHIVFNGIKSRGFIMGKGFGYGQGYGYEYVYKSRNNKQIIQRPKLVRNA